MNFESFFLRASARLGILSFPDTSPPPYEIKRQIIKLFLMKYNVKTAIETGTFLGDTTQFLSECCDRVYSIELAEELAANAQCRFINNPRIAIIHGDSSDRIPELLRTVVGPKLFWLDGHFSGTCYQHETKIVTARGTLDTPIVAELKSILSDSNTHVILIDDARLFTGLSEYPTIRYIKSLCKLSPHKYVVSVDDDIIRILPEATS
jgi:hypothetical protein